MLLLVDLDGVVYRGSAPVPGVAAVLADRPSKGDDVVYVTNNSMHYREDYVARLAAMGAPVSPERVVSSPRATALCRVAISSTVACASPISRAIARGSTSVGSPRK